MVRETTVRLEFDIDGSRYHDWLPYQDGSIALLNRCRRFAGRVQKLLAGNLPDFTLLYDTESRQWFISHAGIIESDYSNWGTVGTANYRYIASLYPEAPSYNSQARIPFIPLTTESIELLNGLADYPVLDDDTLTEYESELQTEYVRDTVISGVSRTLFNQEIPDPRLQGACLFDVLDIIDGLNPNTAAEELSDLWDSLPVDGQELLIWAAFDALNIEILIERNSAYLPDENYSKLAAWIGERLQPVETKIPQGQLLLPLFETAA